MKVGDKVRVKSWEEILKTVDDKYNCINLSKDGARFHFDRDSMYQYTNLTGTISNIDNVTGNVQIKFSKDCSRYWHPCWLDLISEKLTVDKNCSSKWLIFCMIFQYLSGNCPNPSIFKYMFTPTTEQGGFNFSKFKYDFINLQQGKVPFPDWPILNLPLDEAYVILEHCYTYGVCRRDLEFFTDDISTIMFCGFPWNSTPEGDIYWNSRLVNYKYPASEEKLETQIKIENYENKLQRKALSSEEQSQKEVSRAVENAKLQLQSDLLATQSALEDKKQELEDAKSTYPLNAVAIVNLITEVEGLEDGLVKLRALKDELGL